MGTKTGLCVALLLCAAPALSQTPQPAVVQSAGTVNGQVTDANGAAIDGAKITLTPDGDSATLEAVSGADGRFSFLSVPPGPFRLTVSAFGFAVREVSLRVAPREVLDLTPVQLTLAVGTIEVDVKSTRVEIAERQLEEQEQQRLLGVFPNFRVSYRKDAVPLDSRQKFRLTWKIVTDPVRFATVGIGAGIQYARDDYSGFGRGFEGYAKRYAALYATAFTASMISNSLLPAVFRQDPRYFYSGTGTASSRALYAVSRSVVRKGDNGRWQPDYSRILGSLASGALSNLYYPEEDRRSGRLIVENTALVIGGAALGNLFQEFLFNRLTTHAPKVGSPTAPTTRNPEP